MVIRLSEIMSWACRREIPAISSGMWQLELEPMMYEPFSSVARTCGLPGELMKISVMAILPGTAELFTPFVVIRDLFFQQREVYPA